MNNQILVSLLEGLYLYYMFNHFETKISINHPLEFIITGQHDFLKHPIATGIKESKICPLGNLVGKLAILWFLGRHLIKDNKKMIKINKILIGLLFFLSLLMNANAFIYILPIIFIEFKFLF